MTDWTTLSAFATGAGTLVLAAATFSSVRSSNRSARIAEHALLASLRPFLVHGRIDDPVEKITWSDEHMAAVGNGRCVVDVGDDDVIYLAVPVRNAGAGLGVIQGWIVHPDPMVGLQDQPALDDFVRQGRDLYIAGGDSGFWQCGLREDDELRQAMRKVIDARNRFAVSVLYSDSEGGQRTISRFGVGPKGPDTWIASVTRHWNIDRDDPR